MRVARRKTRINLFKELAEIGRVGTESHGGTNVFRCTAILAERIASIAQRHTKRNPLRSKFDRAFPMQSGSGRLAHAPIDAATVIVIHRRLGLPVELKPLAHRLPRKITLGLQQKKPINSPNASRPNPIHNEVIPTAKLLIAMTTCKVATNNATAGAAGRRHGKMTATTKDQAAAITSKHDKNNAIRSRSEATVAGCKRGSCQIGENVARAERAPCEAAHRHQRNDDQHAVPPHRPEPERARSPPVTTRAPETRCA